jgi:two-component system, OmpR family, phosphate regulon response regulator PhoB
MKRIMVIDDLAVIREPIAIALATRGFEAVAIADGIEALHAIQQKLPDLILLDMMMPRCDGLTLLRSLKSQPRTRTIPVIMLTASGDRGDILDAAKLVQPWHAFRAH